MRKSISAVVVLAVLAPAVIAGGLSYQARIQTAGGADINGPVTVGFRIYGAQTGATVLWGETQSVVAVRGIVNVELGKVNPLPPGIFNDPARYLGVTVAGDPEMTPRRRLLSTWRAMSTSKAAGKTVQAGGAAVAVTGASSASVAIVFPRPFSRPPVVMLGAPGSAIAGVPFIPVRVSDVTATGCTALFASLGGATASGTAGFDWIAIGE
jgi:hypothetical protein